MLYLAENIKYLRARRGESQQHLADALGITRTRYSKYEYAIAEPPLELLVKLAEYFGVSIDELAKEDIRRRSIST